MEKYRWISLETGEVQRNLLGVIKTICQDIKWEFKRGGALTPWMFHWQYNHNGF